jgi:signal transduction histidine kinase
MGLAICRKLATEMGAKIYLENPGQAPAKFVISLMKGQDV